MSFKKQSENVKVFVRCRPLLNSEIGDHVPVEVHPDVNKIFVRDSGTERCPVKVFSFDKVFGPEAKQADVYAAVVAPVVLEVIKGFNCTVLAYGQTGTGKTFTIEGGKSENLQDDAEDPLPGVIPRAMNHLFKDLSEQNLDFEIYVSFLELYNEEIFDLLSNSDDLVKLKMFDSTTQKGSVIVQGLRKMQVASMAEVYAILDEGCRKRRKAATLLNQMSSRSHTIFMVMVNINESSSTLERTRNGKLNLVDLAGSENIGRSGAIHKRAREAGNINQSLLALGRVITSLSEKAVHIPYRESKLTRLLRDSLGGQTKTAVIATISPSAAHLDETLNSLDYALRAKSITNKPELNTQVSATSLTKAYLDEINRLKTAINNLAGKDGIHVPEERIRSWETALATKREQTFQVMSQIEAKKNENQLLDASILEANNTILSKKKELDEERKRQQSLREELKKLKEDRELDESMLSILEPVCSKLHEKLHVDLNKNATLEVYVNQMNAKAQTQLDEEQILQQKLNELRSNRTLGIEFLQNNSENLSEKVKDMHKNVHSLAVDCNSYISALQTEFESISRVCEKEFDNLFNSVKNLEGVNNFRENMESLIEEAKSTKLKWMDECRGASASSVDSSVLDPLYKALEDFKLSLLNISSAFKEWKSGLAQKSDRQQKLLKTHLESQMQTLESTNTSVNIAIGELKKNFHAYSQIIMKSCNTHESNKKLMSERFSSIEKAVSSLDVFCTEHIKNESDIAEQAHSLLKTFSENGSTVANTLTAYCADSCQNIDALLEELDHNENDAVSDKLQATKQYVDSCSGCKDLSTALAKCSTSYQDLDGCIHGTADPLMNDLEKKAIHCTQKASEYLQGLGERSKTSLRDTWQQLDLNSLENYITNKLGPCAKSFSETSENEILALMLYVANSKKSLTDEKFEGSTSSRKSSSETSSYLSKTAVQNTTDSSVFIEEKCTQKECPICHDKFGDKTLQAEEDYASLVPSEKDKFSGKKDIHSARKKMQLLDIESLCDQICNTSDEDD